MEVLKEHILTIQKEINQIKERLNIIENKTKNIYT